MSNPIIVYGDSFCNDSPRTRQIKAQRIVAEAMGLGFKVRRMPLRIQRHWLIAGAFACFALGATAALLAGVLQ